MISGIQVFHASMSVCRSHISRADALIRTLARAMTGAVLSTVTPWHSWKAGVPAAGRVALAVAMDGAESAVSVAIAATAMVCRARCRVVIGLVPSMMVALLSGGGGGLVGREELSAGAGGGARGRWRGRKRRRRRG
ncbi:hypothetical protein EAO68_23510 [Streptomyces sp. wa22]|nr:hypothetical protein EAO68_23510 [Streptomyces sp. wa22]